MNSSSLKSIEPMMRANSLPSLLNKIVVGTPLNENFLPMLYLHQSKYLNF